MVAGEGVVGDQQGQVEVGEEGCIGLIVDLLDEVEMLVLVLQQSLPVVLEHWILELKAQWMDQGRHYIERTHSLSKYTEYKCFT